MCVYSNSATWVRPQGWDLGVPWGIGIQFFSFEIQQELLCELLTGVAHATALIIGSLPPWGLGEGPKGQISLNLYYSLVNFKDFKPNFVCLLTNERYRIYQTGFSFDCLGDAPGLGLGGTVGVEGV